MGIASRPVSHYFRFRGRSHKLLEAVVNGYIQQQDAALPPPEQREEIERRNVIRAALVGLNRDYRDVLLAHNHDNWIPNTQPVPAKPLMSSSNRTHSGHTK